MTRPIALPALALALSFAACGPAPEPEDPQLFIGTGTQGSTEFTELSDGAELVLEPGAQGGFHVYIHVRVNEDAIRAMGDHPLISRIARRDMTGDLVSRSKRNLGFVASPTPGMLELEAVVPLFLCPTPIGIPVADETIRLEVEASADESTPGVKGELLFIPRCPEGDQNEFCQNICFG